MYKSNSSYKSNKSNYKSNNNKYSKDNRNFNRSLDSKPRINKTMRSMSGIAGRKF